MSRSLWSGHISFGLVTIPVTVVSAEEHTQVLDFDLIDKRDQAHVGYQKINKRTGKVIDSEDIVKGLKLDNGKFAIFDPEELKQYKIKGTSTIDIQQFVERDEVDPIYFKKFYYLEPGKNGAKTYVLLRETLLKTGKFAVGLIVLHNRQQLVLIGAQEEVLVMHVVHYVNEIKKVDKLDVPSAGLRAAKVSEKEISMAEKLVEDLSEKWKPAAFKDEYFQQIKAAVQSKGRKKLTVDDESADKQSENTETLSKVLDLMPLLERSLGRKTRHKVSRKAAPRSSHRRSAS